MHCYDPQHNITALPAWLADHRITVSTMTVSMLRHLCLLGPRAHTLSALRLLSVGGEAIHSADVEAFRSVFPTSCVLQNAMASTETRTYAQYFVPPTGPVESPVPIGLPVAGKEVLLLDENGNPVPPGCEGEIAVRSRYLANGYANDAQRTAIKFQPQEDGLVLYRTEDRGRFRPDGCLVFLGRTDSQAKIRGHRVELDHVAHILELHPEGPNFCCCHIRVIRATMISSLHMLWLTWIANRHRNRCAIFFEHSCPNTLFRQSLSFCRSYP